MSTAIPASTTTTEATQPGMLSFLVKGAALTASVAVTIYTLTQLIPDGNDYALASNIKHAALAADVPQKIVLVGGSNLAYGIDSALIERETGCPVVNMGMNGYFGARFMLNEVKPHINKGDIVVVAFEYYNYVTPVDGTPATQWMITKVNPPTFDALSPVQKFHVILTYPTSAQMKVERLLTEALANLRRARGIADEPLPPWDMELIETVQGFERHGDLISHLDTRWPEAPQEDLDLTALGTNPEFFKLVRKFSTEMRARDVNVLMSYTPFADFAYAKHQAIVDSWDRTFHTDPAFVTPSHASDYVFDSKLHFDTVYHLNADGRAIRSAKLAADIVRSVPDRPGCTLNSSPETKATEGATK